MEWVQWIKSHAAWIVVTIIAIVALIVTKRDQNPQSCVLDTPLGALPFDCYVINMPHEKKRMRGFMKTWKKCDLAKNNSVIRFDAVIGKHVPIAEYTSSKALCEILRAERNSYRQKHYELTRGGVGCWLSHRNLWKKILQTDKPCAIIFEDDCIMAKNLHTILNDSEIPKDWDICLLGYICNKCEHMQCADAIRVNRFFGLHCYMINKRGIKKILANPKMQLITKQIDSVLCDMIRDGELNVYALPQPVAWQNNVDYRTSIQMELRKVAGVNEWE